MKACRWILIVISLLSLFVCDGGSMKLREKRAPRSSLITSSARDIAHPEICGKDYKNPPLYIENNIGTVTFKIEISRNLDGSQPDLNIRGHHRYNDNKFKGFACGLYGINTTFLTVTHFLNLIMIPEIEWLKSKNYTKHEKIDVWGSKYIPGGGIKSNQTKIRPLVGGVDYVINDFLSVDIIPKQYSINNLKEFMQYESYTVLIIGKAVITSGYVPPYPGRSAGSLIGPWYSVGKDSDSIPCSDSIFSETFEWSSNSGECDYLRTFSFNLKDILLQLDYDYLKTIANNNTNDSNIPQPIPDESKFGPEPHPQPETPNNEPPSYPIPTKNQSSTFIYDLKNFGRNCYDNLNLLEFVNVTSLTEMYGLEEFLKQKFPFFLQHDIELNSEQTACISGTLDLCSIPEYPSNLKIQPILAYSYGNRDCKCRCEWNWQEDFIQYLISTGIVENNRRKTNFEIRPFYSDNCHLLTQFTDNPKDKVAISLPFGEKTLSLYRESKCISFTKGFNSHYKNHRLLTKNITDIIKSSNSDKNRLYLSQILSKSPLFVHKILEKSIFNSNSTKHGSEITKELSDTCESFSFYPLLEFWEGENCDIEESYYKIKYMGVNLPSNYDGNSFNASSCVKKFRPYQCSCWCEYEKDQNIDDKSLTITIIFSVLGASFCIFGLSVAFVDRTGCNLSEIERIFKRHQNKSTWWKIKRIVFLKLCCICRRNKKIMDDVNEHYYNDNRSDVQLKNRPISQIPPSNSDLQKNNHFRHTHSNPYSNVGENRVGYSENQESQASQTWNNLDSESDISSQDEEYTKQGSTYIEM